VLGIAAQIIRTVLKYPVATRQQAAVIVPIGSRSKRFAQPRSERVSGAAKRMGKIGSPKLSHQWPTITLMHAPKGRTSSTVLGFSDGLIEDRALHLRLRPQIYAL
jgi:hypothetical protein